MKDEDESKPSKTFLRSCSLLIHAFAHPAGMTMRVRCNSLVILTFSLAAMAAYGQTWLVPGLCVMFELSPGFSAISPPSGLRLFSYTLGHITEPAVADDSPVSEVVTKSLP